MPFAITPLLDPQGPVVEAIGARFANAMALYAFGSQVRGTAGSESDLDPTVLIDKSATVERCVARAREAYAHGPANFATDFTRQDAAIGLNLPNLRKSKKCLPSIP